MADEENLELEVVDDLYKKLDDIFNEESFSDTAYDIIKEFIDEYMNDPEADGDSFVRDTVGNYLMYTSECWNYLQDNDITDFEAAIGEGFPANIYSIAAYYLEEECLSLLNKLDLLYTD